MNKIIDYKIITEKSIEGLEALVLYMISKGWVPVGSPTLCDCVLAQSLIKYADN